MSSNAAVTQTTRGMRTMLYLAGFLVLSVSLSLYLFPTRTDTYFSWTINPPLTAAFLGGGYAASFLLEFLSARESIWARARVAVPAVLLFTVLTLIVTLKHIDKFHFKSDQWITLAGTWVWMAVYAGVPIIMGWLLIVQLRMPQNDPAPVAPMANWLRLILVAQGGIMLFASLFMLLWPQTIMPIWPWQLSPLTSRAIGAWAAGVGTIAVHAAWENDWWRLRPMMISYTFLGGLQIINLLRFPSTLNWDQLSASVYTLFIVTILLVGVNGWRLSQQANNRG